MCFITETFRQNNLTIILDILNLIMT